MREIILIGERINSTSKPTRKLLEARDEDGLLEIAHRQIAGGASFLDINASMLMEREAETLKWAADVITADGSTGVFLDSPDAGLLIDILPRIEGSVVLNSFTCDRETLAGACEAAAAHGAGLIVMLKNKNGIPATIADRMTLAGEAVSTAERAGLPSERVYIDPVFTPIATAVEGLGIVLGTLAALRERYPGHRRIGGLSNISFGMPNRKLLNRTFLAMALSHGLDAVICDTSDAPLMASVEAAAALIGLDPGCIGFIRSYREKKSR